MRKLIVALVLVVLVVAPAWAQEESCDRVVPGEFIVITDYDPYTLEHWYFTDFPEIEDEEELRATAWEWADWIEQTYGVTADPAAFGCPVGEGSPI